VRLGCERELGDAVIPADAAEEKKKKGKEAAAFRKGRSEIFFRGEKRTKNVSFEMPSFPNEKEGEGERRKARKQNYICLSRGGKFLARR